MLRRRSHAEGSPIQLTLSIPKTLLLMLPLTALAPGPVPEITLSPKNCEKFPIPVWCYRFGDNHSNDVHYNCFNTLCEAVAAGYSQCTTQSHNVPCDGDVALTSGR